MSLDRTLILKQIDQALDEYSRLRAKSKYDDCSDHKTEGVAVGNITASTIDRLAPPGSHHERNLDEILKRIQNPYGRLPELFGSLRALRSDVEHGYDQSLTELVHAGLFSDFIEMAEHLLAQGYKDAAAVIVGSVLEQHLRELCNKNQIAPTIGGKPKKADSLNSELSIASVYSKLDQKSVTSWLGLRNEAAHGHYASYTSDQVKLMVGSVRDFMTRFPA